MIEKLAGTRRESKQEKESCRGSDQNLGWTEYEKLAIQKAH